MSRFFRVAPFDVAVFITTLSFIGVLAFFAIRSAMALLAGNVPELFDLGVSVLLAVIVAYGWIRSVKGYTLAGNEVIVDRTGPGKVHIPIESILSIDAQPDLGSFIRANMLSTQGLFGWAGKVHVRKPTDVKSLFAEVYGTRPSRSVVLHLPEERTVILTPADRDSFVQALSEAGVRGLGSETRDRQRRGEWRGKKRRGT